MTEFPRKLREIIGAALAAFPMSDDVDQRRGELNEVTVKQADAIPAFRETHQSQTAGQGGCAHL
jgi:hypothetical protein